MRIERDYQYSKRHLSPFSAAPFVVAEESLLVARVERLPPAGQKEALELLDARSLTELRSRLKPAIVKPKNDSTSTIRVTRQSLDARTYLTLDLRVDTAEVTARQSGNFLVLKSRTGRPVRFTVRLSTNAPSLTPLKREEIFNREFLRFLSDAGTAGDSVGIQRYRRLERQVRAVELLSSKEKLMAGLPNFATYFGRDMMMTALMMRPIWTAGMSEHVIASVLRKLGPNGDVSHEEALGGQAIRENAVVYDSLVRVRPVGRGTGGSRKPSEDSRELPHDRRRVPAAGAGRRDTSPIPPFRPRKSAPSCSTAPMARGSRLSLLLREMALVTTWTRPYVG